MQQPRDKEPETLRQQVEMQRHLDLAVEALRLQVEQLHNPLQATSPRVIAGTSVIFHAHVAVLLQHHQEERKVAARLLKDREAGLLKVAKAVQPQGQDQEVARLQRVIKDQLQQHQEREQHKPKAMALLQEKEVERHKLAENQEELLLQAKGQAVLNQQEMVQQLALEAAVDRPRVAVRALARRPHPNAWAQ
jgi:hypothetical protein